VDAIEKAFVTFIDIISFQCYQRGFRLNYNLLPFEFASLFLYIESEIYLYPPLNFSFSFTYLLRGFSPQANYTGRATAVFQNPKCNGTSLQSSGDFKRPRDHKNSRAGEQVHY
jgi:hypothetical protein